MFAGFDLMIFCKLVPLIRYFVCLLMHILLFIMWSVVKSWGEHGVCELAHFSFHLKCVFDMVFHYYHYRSIQDQ